MAEKKVYIGTQGPYLYDDDGAVSDPDGDFTGVYCSAVLSDGALQVGSIRLFDTDQSNYLELLWNEDDSANRTLNLLVGGGSRSLTLNENLTIADGYNISLQALGQANAIVFNEAFTIGNGYAGTLTFGSACTLTVELSSIINQDLTTDAGPTFASCNLGTGELTCGSINRASGSLTLEIAGTAVITAAAASITLAQTVVLSDCINAGADVDKFLVRDASNNIDYRTGAEVLSDIGAAASSHDHDDLYYTETEVDTWRNSVTQTEMGYLHGVTSGVQTQLDVRCLESVFGTSIGAGLLLDGTVLKASAVLQVYHGINPSADVQSLLGCANEAAIRTLLDLEAGTDFYSIAAADAAFAPITHASTHGVGQADAIFPADPGADRVLMWDDDPGELVWSSAGTGDVTAAANITDNRIVRGDGGAKGVQESLATIDDSGNIVLPDGGTIGTSDPDAIAIRAAGILTFSGQSGCGVQQAADFVVPTATGILLPVTTNLWDVQDEFDNTYVTGTADATGANKLHDADGGFSADLVGATVYNTTDYTYTTVSGFVDNGELDLTNDIMVSGEGYRIYWSRFTAGQTGKYMIAASCYFSNIGDGKVIYLYFKKNGATSGTQNFIQHGATGDCGITITGFFDLSASDYIEVWIYHDHGSVRTLIHTYTFLNIAKVA